MNFSFINNVEHLYEQPIRFIDGLFVCPVCEKTYKTEKAIDTHIKRRDCHSTAQLFSDTGVEENAYDLYVDMVSETNPSAKVTLKNFRKSNSYTPCIRFVMFSMEHKVQPAIYCEWVKCFYKTKYINQTFSKGNSESSIREFRKYLRDHEELIDSELFYEMNESDLAADDQFLVNAIYLGQIGLTFCADRLNLVQRLETMDQGLKFRLERMFDE